MRQAQESPPGLSSEEPHGTPPPRAATALMPGSCPAPRSDEAAAPPKGARRTRAPRMTRIPRRPSGQQHAVCSDYEETDALGRYGSRSCRMPCAPGVGPGLSLPTVYYKLRGGIYRCAHRPDKDRPVRFCARCRGMKLTWEQLQERATNVLAWYTAQGLKDEYLLYWGPFERELVGNVVMPERASKGEEAAAGLLSATAVPSGLAASERQAASALADLPWRQTAAATSPLRRPAPLLHAAQLPLAAPAAPPHVAAAAVTPSGPAPGCRAVFAQQLAAVDAMMASALEQQEAALAANTHALAVVEAALAQSPTVEELSALLQRFSDWRKRALEAVLQLAAAELRLTDAMPAALAATLAAARNAASAAVATAAAGGEPVATGAALDAAALAASHDAAAESPGGGEQRVESAAEDEAPSPKRARLDSR